MRASIGSSSPLPFYRGGVELQHESVGMAKRGERGDRYEAAVLHGQTAACPDIGGLGL